MHIRKVAPLTEAWIETGPGTRGPGEGEKGSIKNGKGVDKIAGRKSGGIKTLLYTKKKGLF